MLEGRKKETSKRAKKKHMEEKEKINRKKRELQGNQQEWLQEAIAERERRGETGFMANMYALYDVTQRHKTELQKESNDLKKKLGN